jgi:LacI family transcriptional regulator
MPIQRSNSPIAAARRPGSKAISVHDVAGHAGVSLGTVSNALNRPHLVSPDTLETIRRSIEILGYVRNDSARQLRAGHSRTLGLIVMDVANPFFTDIARGVEDSAQEAGLAVILCNSDESVDKENRYLDLLEELRVRGIIVTPVDAVGAKLKTARQRGVAVVLLDRRAPTRDQCSVWVDDVLGGELAVKHLIEMGHRRIAFIQGPKRIAQVEDRFKGAKRAVRKSGRDDIELLTISAPSLTTAGGIEAARQMRSAACRPTAAFCANDLLAMGVLQQTLAVGDRVPQDLAIVGYDDIDYVAAASHPLSSVRQPRRLMGSTAARLLIHETEHPESHQHEQVVFKPELIVRQSSDYRCDPGST